MSNVKFDICDEHASEQNSEFGETNTARGMDEYDLESNFKYTPHPLVVSLLFSNIVIQNQLKPNFGRNV